MNTGRHPVQWALLGWCGLSLTIEAAYLHLWIAIVPAALVTASWLLFLAMQVDAWMWLSAEWRRMYYEHAGRVETEDQL